MDELGAEVEGLTSRVIFNLSRRSHEPSSRKMLGKAHLIRGISEYKSGDYSAGIHDLTKAIESNPALKI